MLRNRIFKSAKCYIHLCMLAVHPDVNVANSRGWTALMFAAHNGHQSAVRTLLDNG